MRTFFTTIAIFISFLIYGQASVETVTVASNKLTVSPECKVEGERKVNCGNYKVEWTYGDEQKVKGLQDAFLEFGGMLDKFKKKRLDFYLFDKKVKGYKVSYKNPNGTTYQISVAGVVNGEPVWVLVSLDQEPVTNDDMPPFVKQIIRFLEPKK